MSGPPPEEPRRALCGWVRVGNMSFWQPLVAARRWSRPRRALRERIG